MKPFISYPIKRKCVDLPKICLFLCMNLITRYVFLPTGSGGAGGGGSSSFGGGLAGGPGGGLQAKLAAALGGHSKETKAAMSLLGVSPAQSFMDGLKVGLGGGTSKIWYVFL